MAEDIIFDYDFELVSIQLNIAEIRLSFGSPPKSLAVDFNVSIDVMGQNSNQPVETIVPWDRLGDLRAIWPLIGVSMDRIVMDGRSFRLSFKNGITLRSRNENISEIVNVWGPNTEPGREYLTRYPDDLNVGPAGEIRDPVHQILRQDQIVVMPKLSTREGSK